MNEPMIKNGCSTVVTGVHFIPIPNAIRDISDTSFRDNPKQLILLFHFRFSAYCMCKIPPDNISFSTNTLFFGGRWVLVVGSHNTERRKECNCARHCSEGTGQRGSAAPGWVARIESPFWLVFVEWHMYPREMTQRIIY